MNKAKAAGETSLPNDALADLVRAIDLSEDGSTRKAFCIEAAMSSGVFNQVIKLRPDEPMLWIGRAEYYALRSQWPQAATDYAKVIHSRPVSAESWEYAYLLLLLDERQEYRQFCQELVDRPSEPLDAYAAGCMARICAAGPSDAVDTTRLLEWATQYVDAAHNAWSLHTLGLVQYRAGQYDLAIDNLQRSNAIEWGKNGLEKAQNWFVLAMAHQRLGQGDAAQQCLETARQLIARAQPKKPGARLSFMHATGFQSRCFRARLKRCCNQIHQIPNRKPQVSSPQLKTPNPQLRKPIPSPQPFPSKRSSRNQYGR